MPELTFRGRAVASDRALIMGIVDGDPPQQRFDEATAHAAISRASTEGADVIDLGGAAAEPGGTSAEQEIDEVVPRVQSARKAFPDAVINVDAHRHEVAEQVCQAGADIVNDTGSNADGGVIDVAARHGAGYVCTHTLGRNPRDDRDLPHYADIVDSVVEETTRLADEALSQGVPRSGILIDPAIDVQKDTHHSLTVLRHLDALVETGWPVLVSVSNKEVVGETLDVADDDRLTGTLAATALAAHSGAAVFRAHQVAETRQTVEMVASVDGYRAPARAERWS